MHRGSRRDAIDVALGLLGSGLAAEHVVSGLLARAQAEVGRGWQEGRWSVATEHRASAITESALQAVIDTALRAPTAVPEGSRGRAVVACSEGEWHVLPGRMASEVLRLRGADVSFIGPSVPAEDLAAFLGDDPPVAVAITCSMPMSLGGTWRTVTALRALGMTVVCGGRGFGPYGRWGLDLGADLWAQDFADGADLLLAAIEAPRPRPREPAGDPDAVAELRVVRRDIEHLAEQATQTALAAWPFLRGSDAAQIATREDLLATLRTVASATIVGDEGLVADYVAWFESVLAARALPVAYVSTAFALLLDVLPTGLPLSRGMAIAGLDACSVPPWTVGPGGEAS